MRVVRPVSIIVVVLALAALAPAAPVNFFRNALDTDFPGSVYPDIRAPVDVKVADLDGDADMDLVASVTHFAGSGEGIYWYENDGAFAFSKTLIDTTLVENVDIDGVHFDVGDIDDDLDLDIVLCGANRVYLYKNGGGGTFTRTTIDATAGAVRRAEIGDLDGDLDEDVALLANAGLFWLQNDGSESFTRYPIEEKPVTDVALVVVDLDGDGDLDVVSSTNDIPTGDGHFTWYESLGLGSFIYHVFDVLQGTEDLGDAFVADVDRDGLLDITVVKTTDDAIWWYEDTGSHVYSPHAVTTAFDNPSRVWVTDLDNDSDMDIVATGGTGATGFVAYWENDGLQSFTFRSIEATTGSREGLFVVDIDQDSLDDLFVTSNSPAEVIWFDNLGTGTAVGNTPGSERVQIYPNVPNPFNPSTTIGFEVAPAGAVDVDVFSVAGAKVRTLVHGPVSAGYHEARWDGRDDAGRRVASGVYIARVRAHGASSTHKMVLLM